MRAKPQSKAASRESKSASGKDCGLVCCRRRRRRGTRPSETAIHKVETVTPRKTPQNNKNKTRKTVKTVGKTSKTGKKYKKDVNITANACQ